MLEIDKSKQIILVEAHNPIKADKIKYYDEKAFATRASLQMTDVPMLKIVENKIPKFDITHEKPPPKPDPNQYVMLEDEEKLSANMNLTDEIS